MGENIEDAVPTQARLNELEKLLGHKFRDPSLLL